MHQKVMARKPPSETWNFTGCDNVIVVKILHGSLLMFFLAFNILEV